MVFENLLNPVLWPLLKIDPLLAVLLISFLISLIIVVVYKFMTNQTLMKQLKDELKEYQKEMKELRDHPEKVLEVQKKAMDTNMKYMMHSLRPTLITFLPIIIIFGWLNAHLAYLPIAPDVEFRTTIEFQKGAAGAAEIIVPEDIVLISDASQKIAAQEASWAIKGPKGRYVLEYKFNDISYTKDVIITDEKEYATPAKVVNDDYVRTIKIMNEPLKPLNLFGWKIGWLGTYIIASIAFSILLRKLMKVY